MSKFRLFGFNQYGELVYRKTGRAAPSSYTVRGNTVYGKDGRKIGNVGKGTKTQQQTMRKAATAGGRTPVKLDHGKQRFSFNKIRKAREKALQTTGKLQLVTPQATAKQKANFGKSVRSMAKFSIGQNPALEQKIKQMDDEKLWQMYQDNEMIFDVYFDYGGISDTDKGRVGNKQTAANAQALIDSYEARYGSLGIQTTFA